MILLGGADIAGDTRFEFWQRQLWQVSLNFYKGAEQSQEAQE